MAWVDEDGLWQRPTLAEQIIDCRRLLADFDDTAWVQMDALFYQQGYEELRINLGLLLDLLAEESPEAPVSEPPGV